MPYRASMPAYEPTDDTNIPTSTELKIIDDSKGTNLFHHHGSGSSGVVAHNLPDNVHRDHAANEKQSEGESTNRAAAMKYRTRISKVIGRDIFRGAIRGEGTEMRISTISLPFTRINVYREFALKYKTFFFLRECFVNI